MRVWFEFWKLKGEDFELDEEEEEKGKQSSKFFFMLLLSVFGLLFLFLLWYSYGFVVGVVVFHWFVTFGFRERVFFARSTVCVGKWSKNFTFEYFCSVFLSSYSIDQNVLELVSERQSLPPVPTEFA